MVGTRTECTADYSQEEGLARAHHVDQELVLEAVEIPFGLQICQLLVPHLHLVLQMTYLQVLLIRSHSAISVQKSHRQSVKCRLPAALRGCVGCPPPWTYCLLQQVSIVSNVKASGGDSTAVSPSGEKPDEYLGPRWKEYQARRRSVYLGLR